ncbi:MAG TPA: alkaline phosphatase family protein [Planctomycetota bacterium]|nr:alkaline phosphatase family protein [Planctomycetota bacterium]
MKPLLVLNVVGLTPALLGGAPNLRKLAASGFEARLGAVLPAVTCSAQSTLLTGLLPRGHGIVGNGWYFRDLSEVWFWRQSNRLVAGKKVWEAGRERNPGFTCAKLFWWYNMYSSADWSVTPRPIYAADGRKFPGIYTHPRQLKSLLDLELGTFPLFNFWGPAADLRSSEWIARAARLVIDAHRPTLTLVYLPHLDYDLQRHGPSSGRIQKEVLAIDRVAGELIDHARGLDMEVIVLSEYGITQVASSISINRVLRRAGLLSVQETLGLELLDAGASRAFAVSDHQVAHVYVRDPADTALVRDLLVATEGIEAVLGEEGKAEHGLDHPRSGELIAISRRDRWFDYYYWLDDSHAPDFAPTVDIHRKPGYDPAELFLDPAQRFVKLKIMAKLLKKSLGFRYLMDVVPIESSLVRGSHGRLPDDPAQGPILLSSSRKESVSSLDMTAVPELILATILG